MRANAGCAAAKLSPVSPPNDTTFAAIWGSVVVEVIARVTGRTSSTGTGHGFSALSTQWTPNSSWLSRFAATPPEHVRLPGPDSNHGSSARFALAPQAGLAVTGEELVVEHRARVRDVRLDHEQPRVALP